MSNNAHVRTRRGNCMKLSTLFEAVHALWATSSLFQIAAWVVLVGTISYASYRVAARQYSSPKVYLVSAILFVVVIGLLEGARSLTSMITNPVISMLLAASVGAGTNVYQRLAQNADGRRW